MHIEQSERVAADDRCVERTAGEPDRTIPPGAVIRAETDERVPVPHGVFDQQLTAAHVVDRWPKTTPDLGCSICVCQDQFSQEA